MPGLYLGVRHATAIAERRSYLLRGVSAVLRGGRVEVVVPRAQLVVMQNAVEERAVYSALRNVASAQAQTMASAVIDADRDDHGEYGFFGELAGVALNRAPAPGGETKIRPPVIDKVFGRVESGCVVVHGYLLQMFLPGQQGWLAENTNGGAEGLAVDANRAERLWRCYAWPMVAGKTGQKAFFVDQTGEVYSCANTKGRYSGYEKRPTASAAVVAEGPDAKAAAHCPGSDGQVWHPQGAKQR